MNAKSNKTGVGELYDWWSRHPRALDILYDVAFLGREGTLRNRAIEALTPSSGERVLEVGCRNGNSFAAIREGVRADGSLVGMDMSRGMVRLARKRIRDRDWQTYTSFAVTHAVHRSLPGRSTPPTLRCHLVQSRTRSEQSRLRRPRFDPVVGSSYSTRNRSSSGRGVSSTRL